LQEAETAPIIRFFCQSAELNILLIFVFKFSVGMKRFFYVFLFMASAGFYACSNDIDLTATYKDITVVYGLLDPKAEGDTNWIRIQKAYLGDGDALMFGQISDSLYYDTLFTYLLAYNASGTKIDSIPLEKVIDPFPKDSGVFAFDKNILYRTTEQINSNYKYRLVIIKPTKQDTTYSETILCKNFFMSYPPNSSTIINFEDPTGINKNPTITVRWTHDVNTSAYQLGFRFNYQEWIVSDPGNKVMKSFTYYFPMFTIFNEGGGYNAEHYDVGANLVKHAMKKTDFYGAIVSNIAADPPGTPAMQQHVRSYYSMDFVVLQATEELYKYITINKPSLSYVQKVSDYTNIEDGMGIFGSRSSSGINDLSITQQTRDSLRLGHFTVNLNFQ